MPSSPRTLPVLLAQLDAAGPAGPDALANAHRAVRLLDAHPTARLAVFPELFLPGYRLDGLAARISRPGSPELRLLSAAAARLGTALIVGCAVPPDDTAGGAAGGAASGGGGGGAAGVSIGAVCIDEYGRPAGTYRKTHLFGAERTAVRPGGRLLVSTLAGVAVAPLICYDVEFPEPARAVADAGAELLVTVSANMAPYRDEHEVLPRARAMENRLPHVYVNRVGAESGFRFLGRSRVWDAAGTLRAALPEEVAEARLVDVPLELGPLTGPGPRPDHRADRRGPLTVRTLHTHAEPLPPAGTLCHTGREGIRWSAGY